MVSLATLSQAAFVEGDLRLGYFAFPTLALNLELSKSESKCECM